MGRTYLFECEKCGYRAKVGGGTQRGRHLTAQTILCLDCRVLFDAVTELKVPAVPASNLNQWKLKPDRNPKKAPRFETALNRLLPGDGRFHWIEFKPACPVSERHRVRIWKQPGKCPKCGVFLDGSAAPYKQWE